MAFWGAIFGEKANHGHQPTKQHFSCKTSLSKLNLLQNGFLKANCLENAHYKPNALPKLKYQQNAFQTRNEVQEGQKVETSRQIKLWSKWSPKVLARGNEVPAKIPSIPKIKVQAKLKDNRAKARPKVKRSPWISFIFWGMTQLRSLLHLVLTNTSCFEVADLSLLAALLIRSRRLRASVINSAWIQHPYGICWAKKHLQN